MRSQPATAKSDSPHSRTIFATMASCVPHKHASPPNPLGRENSRLAVRPLLVRSSCLQLPSSRLSLRQARTAGPAPLQRERLGLSLLLSFRLVCLECPRVFYLRSSRKRVEQSHLPPIPNQENRAGKSENVQNAALQPQCFLTQSVDWMTAVSLRLRPRSHFSRKTVIGGNDSQAARRPPKGPFLALGVQSPQAIGPFLLSSLACWLLSGRAPAARAEKGGGTFRCFPPRIRRLPRSL